VNHHVIVFLHLKEDYILRQYLNHDIKIPIVLIPVKRISVLLVEKLKKILVMSLI